MLDGIKASFKESITKYSEKAGRDIEFNKESELEKAPPILFVHFVRFFWKPKEQVKAKILKVLP
jgi:ubiquitin carboxyl-terminal hydrolase 14